MSSKKKSKPAVEALDMQAPIEQSPEIAQQAPLVIMTEDQARNYTPAAPDPDKVMAEEYDKCGSSLPLLLRAILRELVIMRCTHGH